jgi:hypothetical protein
MLARCGIDTQKILRLKSYVYRVLVLAQAITSVSFLALGILVFMPCISTVIARLVMPVVK